MDDFNENLEEIIDGVIEKILLNKSADMIKRFLNVLPTEQAYEQVRLILNSIEYYSSVGYLYEAKKNVAYAIDVAIGDIDYKIVFELSRKYSHRNISKITGMDIDTINNFLNW